MRPPAPFRLSLLRTSLGPRRTPMLPFHARTTLSSPFSTHPNRAQQQQPASTEQLGYFRKLDNAIAEKFGIGRNMRIVLYAIVGVASAIETWFYCFWTYQWWKRRGGEETDHSEA